MIQHHPDDDLLLGLAAGRLGAGQSLLVEVHVESCVRCRARLAPLQATGGALLEACEPVALGPQAFERTLARLDAGARAADGAGSHARAPVRPALPGGVAWPRGLRDADVGAWRWLGPGMRWARARLPWDPNAALFLLRIAPGRRMPHHGHAGEEYTQVLCGAFEDGRARFAAGDFDATDEHVRHRPVVQAGGDCVCLAWLGGPLRFEGWLAGTVGRMIGM